MEIDYHTISLNPVISTPLDNRSQRLHSIASLKDSTRWQNSSRLPSGVEATLLFGVRNEPVYAGVLPHSGVRQREVI